MYPAQLFDGELGTWGRNRIIAGLDGGWLFPLYNESRKEMGPRWHGWL